MFCTCISHIIVVSTYYAPKLVSEKLQVLRIVCILYVFVLPCYLDCILGYCNSAVARYLNGNTFREEIKHTRQRRGRSHHLFTHKHHKQISLRSGRHTRSYACTVACGLQSAGRGNHPSLSWEGPLNCGCTARQTGTCQVGVINGVVIECLISGD